MHTVSENCDSLSKKVRGRSKKENNRRNRRDKSNLIEVICD
jgi:hypothetical protein